MSHDQLVGLFVFLGAISGGISGWIAGKVVCDLGAQKPYKAVIYSCALSIGFWLFLGLYACIGLSSLFIAILAAWIAMPLTFRMIEFTHAQQLEKVKAQGVKELREDPEGNQQFFIGVGAIVGLIGGAIGGVALATECGLVCAVLGLTLGAPLLGILAVGSGVFALIAVGTLSNGVFYKSFFDWLTSTGSFISRKLGAKDGSESQA